MKGEKLVSHLRNCLALSKWLNPSPSAVNPIFPVHKSLISVLILPLQGSLYILSWSTFNFFQAEAAANFYLMRVIIILAVYKLFLLHRCNPKYWCQQL